MSFSYTALQLVNRVNRMRRQKDSGSITSLEEFTTLDMVNHAMNHVLSTREWEWDKRTTQLTTRALVESVSFTTNADSSAVIVQKTGLTNAQLVGDFVTRFSLKGSTDYPNTSVRALTASTVVANGSTLRASSTLGSAYTGTTGELFYAEYLLPETVRNVLRATHQEDTLTLDQVGASVEFDELYPRPQIRRGSPEIVSVGGFDVSTYQFGGTAPKPRLRMIVFPVPDDEYVIDYSYMYRHPELTAATDTLDGVPPEIVDKIVDIAAAAMKGNFDRLLEESEVMNRRSERGVDEIHKRHRGMSADRARVGNWDGEASRFHDGYSITQGRTIGGD